jgi:phenylalanyl-tRNA synthetase beta chain
MKISVNWLSEFVEIPSDPRRLKADLTMVGLNVESYEQVGDDWVLDVEVTTNRPDCLSHFGVARELAALYREPLKRPEITLKESGAPASDAASIEIVDPDLCARYCGRVIQNVQVKPSPEWLARRLEAIGQRPINNVADVTNYVLMELGHPLHAFDLAHLRQHKIIVRRARPGEPLRTLDGVSRTLSRENLVIADGERPVALAGVMGGKESEISSATHAVLLESAWFEPVSIRRTAKSQGMHTEASHRFERGADIEMAPVALDRTAQLIQELAGGEILCGMIDVYPQPFQPAILRLRRSEILRNLGADVPGEEVERILRALSFQVERDGSEAWRVMAPSFRPDVSREVDLIEEVARQFGYDRLPLRLRPAPPRLERDELREKEMKVSAILVGLGYREIISSSMVDPEESARFTERPPVVLANPLSQDASAMRSSAVPSMLRALRWNLDRDQNDVRLFEVGKTYNLRPDGSPEEHRVLTLGATGYRRAMSVHEGEKPLDFFDLKGDLEDLLGAFDVIEASFEPDGCGYYEKGIAGRFNAQGETLVRFGRLSGDVQRDYKLRQAVWLAEVDFERLLGFSLWACAFRPFSKFPAVVRDLSLVVPQGISYARLAAAVNGLRLEELRGFQPVDFASSAQVPALPAGHYSLLLRLTLQSRDRTLTSEEVGVLSQAVLRALEPLGVRLRD